MKPASQLRMPTGPLSRWLTAAGVLLALGLAGCGGSGPPGATGSSGTGSDGGITTSPNLTAANDAPGVVLTVTGVSGGHGPGGHFKPGDKPAVTFTITKTDGSAWHLSEMGGGSIFLSGPTFNYQRVIAKQSDLVDRAVANRDGSYTYTFATAIPAKYLAPYNDSATYGASDGELQGTALLDGTYTIGLAAYWNYTVDGAAKRDVGNTAHDILLGSTAVAAPHEVIADQNCNTCHVSLQAHGGMYRDTRLCVLCHTAGAEDLSASYPGGVAGTRVDFKVMIHRIHDGAHLPSVNGIATNNDGSRNYAATPVNDVIIGWHGSVNDFSAANFPVFPSFQSSMPRKGGYSALASGSKTLEAKVLQGVVSCYKCHGDPDASGPLSAPSQGALSTTQPSRRACGSCHDDVDWAKPYVKNGMTMPAQADDASCTTCHATTGDTLAAGIAVAGGTVPPTPFAHAHPLADPNHIAAAGTYNNGINFAITGTSGNAAAYYVAGEKPAITFTVKDNAGSDIPFYKLSALSTTLVGPTNNRQLVFPLNGPKSITIPLGDFSGRLVSTSATNKGIMSRVIGSTASETLKVQFSSATAFTVTAGSTLVARGAGALPASPSTNPASSSVSAIELSAAAVVQNITIAFTDATNFTVTGSSSGSLGSGVMPAGINASTRFTSGDASVAFTITSGANTFATGNSIYLTVFQTSANSHKFALVAGRTSFANGDRFVYETIDNSLTSYTANLPMDMYYEHLGNGATGVAGETFTAANLPVYWGRETVYERTAMAGAGQANTTLSAGASARDRYVDLAAVTNLAANDNVVLDQGVAGAEEYLQVGVISGNRVFFKTPIRYAHANAATCKEVTLTQRLETTNYTLVPATGVITTVTPLTIGNALVVSYRTDGAFGWYRRGGDTLQSVYPPPPNDSADLGQTWGEWNGLAFQNGTYTAAIWGSLPIYVTQYNETQTYSLASVAATANVLYGAAGTAAPYALVSSQENCEKCHDQITFHGGSRKGNDTCVVCHGIAGMEDWPAYAGSSPAATTGVTANFRTMLHKIHMGEELANASTYTVVGNSGSSSTYDEVKFPAAPGKAKACETCHGEGSSMWKEPADRAHAAQTTPTRTWNAVCSSCHDSTATATHISAMTTGGGVESCATCHGTGQTFAVDVVHKNR